MKFTVFCLALLLSLTTSATTTPFNRPTLSRFQALEAGTSIATGAIKAAHIDAGAVGASELAASSITEADTITQAADGLHLKRIARATLDCGVEDCSAGDVGLGVTLPADSLILRAWYYTVTQFVDAGSGTVALECEDSGNIDAAADITGITVGTITQTDVVAGAEVAAIAAACEITAVVATAEQTAGKLILFVEYVVVE